MSDTAAKQYVSIKLTVEQTDRLLAWAGAHTRAELDADCEPSGYFLEIAVALSYGCSATARNSADRLDLGDVDFDLVRSE
jgi:hypothetical protein